MREFIAFLFFLYLSRFVVEEEKIKTGKDRGCLYTIVSFILAIISLLIIDLLLGKN